MSDQPQPETLSGPDLGAGLSAVSLRDGVPLLGRVGGEPVILVRRGPEIFAIGGTRSHYGVRSPKGWSWATRSAAWHHACFSLRTGEAIRPAGDAVENEIIVGRNLEDQSLRFMRREYCLNRESAWHQDARLE